MRQCGSSMASAHSVPNEPANCPSFSSCAQTNDGADPRTRQLKGDMVGRDRRPGQGWLSRRESARLEQSPSWPVPGTGHSERVRNVPTRRAPARISLGLAPMAAALAVRVPRASRPSSLPPPRRWPSTCVAMARVRLAPSKTLARTLSQRTCATPSSSWESGRPWWWATQWAAEWRCVRATALRPSATRAASAEFEPAVASAADSACASALALRTCACSCADGSALTALR